MNICNQCDKWAIDCKCPLLQPGESIKLRPCPLCEGPPVLHVYDGITRRSFDGSKNYPVIGRYLSAYVFCHECGCQTTGMAGDCYDQDDLRRLEELAVRAWNTRNNRHRGMYDAGERRGPTHDYPDPRA